MTITRTCSPCDLSGLVRPNAPDEVLVVLGIALPVTVAPLDATIVVAVWLDVVPDSKAEVVGVLVTVPVGKNAVTTYSFVPRDQV